MLCVVQETIQKEVQLMKRFVAVCLLIVCLVLPLTSIAGFCPKCGKSHAVAVVFYSYTQQNNTYHTVTAEAYLYCPDCNKRTDLGSTSYSARHTNLTHYHQTLSLTLMYEYDVCNDCGARINTTTHPY